MNCKPNQLAWIVVPPQYRGTGVEQIDRHIVMTKQLVPGFPEATWRIEPPQRVKFMQFMTDASNRLLGPGHVGETTELPDSWLRPFDPLSEPSQAEGVDLLHLPVLEQTL